jgi:ABC-type branched-subunit amino acid transport system substrate-binding protein
MVKAGALTAIEQINAAGGANGNKFEAVMMDDACEPKQAVAVANKIVSQGIKYVIGHVLGLHDPASDIYENEGVVMITPSATAPQLTEAKPQSSSSAPSAATTSKAAAAYVIEKLKPKKVAVLHDKQSYGQGVSRGEAAGCGQGAGGGVRRHQRRRQRLLGHHHQVEVAGRGLRLLRRLPPGNGPAACARRVSRA